MYGNEIADNIAQAKDEMMRLKAKDQQHRDLLELERRKCHIVGVELEKSLKDELRHRNQCARLETEVVVLHEQLDEQRRVVQQEMLATKNLRTIVESHTLERSLTAQQLVSLVALIAYDEVVGKDSTADDDLLLSLQTVQSHLCDTSSLSAESVQLIMDKLLKNAR